MAKDVSVVIPAYNARTLIARCLQALSQQTYPLANIEVLVVDDGSSDGSVQYIRDLCQSNFSSHLDIVILQQPHQGPAAARNLGAQMARGQWLLFTDADCEPDPNWIREMTAPFAAGDIAAVKGAYKTRQRELVARFAQAEFESRYRKLAGASSVDVVFSYSAAFRREIFLKIGGYDPSFPTADNEDTDLSYRLATAGYRIAFNPSAIVYHSHPATLWAYLRKKHSRAYWRMLVYTRFPQKALHDSYTPQSLKAQMGAVYLAIAGLPLLTITKTGIYLLVLASTIFIVTAAPFIWHIPSKDWALRGVAPFLLLGRAIAMSLGAIRAIPQLLDRGPWKYHVTT